MAAQPEGDGPGGPVVVVVIVAVVVGSGGGGSGGGGGGGVERDDDIETYVKAKLEQPDAHVSTHIQYNCRGS